MLYNWLYEQWSRFAGLWLYIKKSYVLCVNTVLSRHLKLVYESSWKGGVMYFITFLICSVLMAVKSQNKNDGATDVQRPSAQATECPTTEGPMVAECPVTESPVRPSAQGLECPMVIQWPVIHKLTQGGTHSVVDHISSFFQQSPWPSQKEDQG